MKNYAKIAPGFWTGTTGKAIRDAGRDVQVVALYLCTCPSSNWIGLYYLPLPTLCHEVGIKEKEAAAALRILESLEFAYYDAANEIVWLPGGALHQMPGRSSPSSTYIAKIFARTRKVGISHVSCSTASGKARQSLRR